MRRLASRWRVELIHERLKSLLEGATRLTAITEDELQKNIMLVEDCSNELTSEIHFYLEKGQQTSLEKLKLFTQTQFKVQEWKVDMKLLLKNSNQEKAAESMAHQTSAAKLPKLSLPKFKGEVLRWSEFWDRFKNNIDGRSLPEAEKMAYLVGCLEGEALQSVEGLSITDLNYKVAVEVLKNRYGKEYKVIDAHYKAIHSLKRAGNATECRSNLNLIDRHLRVLQTLGEEINGNTLRSSILSKFPERMVYELHLVSKEDMDIPTIRTGLQKIISAMEISNEVPASSSSASTQEISTGVLQISSKPQVRKGKQRLSLKTGLRVPKRKRTESIDMRPNMNKKPKKSCIFCEGDHYNASCTEVKSIEERKKKLGRRCYLCFREGHKTTTCSYKQLCYVCKGKHNQALCPQSKSGNTPIIRLAALPSNDRNTIDCSQSYLQTAVVSAGHQDSSKNKQCRILLDSGSQRSYITAKLAKELKLPVIREDLLMIFVFGADSPVEVTSPLAEVEITTRRGTVRNIQVNVVPHITDKISPPIPIEDVDITADDGSAGDNIQVLIGSDYYFSFFKNEMKQLKDNLYLVNTDFGWMVTGKIMEEEKANALSVVTYCQCQEPEHPYLVTPDLPLREPDIKFLWALESIGITDSPKVTREEETVKHFNDTVKYEDNRYQVKWPWIVYPPDLPTNYGLAYGRLSSLVRRMQPDTLQEYDSILREQLAAGIIEVIEPNENNSVTHPVHYLPHHIVIQKGKRSRIVYDASAKLRNNRSLNECLYRGPSMLEDLTALLLNFRIHRIGITADVEKAFLQVGLQPEDRDVTRFLWLKDTKQGVTEENVLHMRFCRVPFGIISSPFLLTATIRHHLSRGDHTLMSEIADRTYVDNLVSGTDTLEKARDLITKTRAVFTELSMNIREWTSNNRQLMKSIPKRYQAKDTETSKVLGLTWHLEKDTLKLRLNETLADAQKNDVIPSKRRILQTLASLYDPCGFAAPLILPAKLLLQELWKRKLKWDTPLPEELDEEWQGALKALKSAAEIEVPRYLGDTSEEETECQLHCFTDASKKGFSAVTYLRIVDKKGNNTKVVFIMAKSRVTPINHKEDLKIPKLELLGFVIGKRLLTYVKDSLGLKIKRLCLWSDSEIVLYWMKSEKLLPPFVSRRINEVKQSKDIEPRYVNSEFNPADLATRPELWHMKKELWTNGPQFLLLGGEGWPRLQEHGQAALFTSLEPESHRDEVKLTQNEDVPEISSETEITEEGTMEVEETESVGQDINDNNNLIRMLQKAHFPQEIAGKKTSLSRNLGLFMDMEGILRCKGRLMNTMCSYDTKHPILIPKNSEFTYKLIQETHEQYYHVGTPHTLSIIRQKYWIPQGRAKVQRILRKCQQCIKHGGGPYKLPPTPALPTERANYSAPFTYTGIDYFGPILIKENGEVKKRWICLYTCLAVRAVHMECVRDLTAEECLLAMRRFISTRGRPELIVSDNALQFKLTADLLSDAYFMDNKIRWKFIPQLSPWHGAFYERLVAIMKNCLKRTLEKQMLNDAQLNTVIKEIEAVANTRPLTCVGSEVEYVLRPADFLTFGRCIEIVPSVQRQGQGHHPGGTVTKENLIEGWKKGQSILEEFKRMFMGQYLCSLRERYHHSHKEPRVRAHRSPLVGDIVQIKGESKNRENWRVGKITNLERGADGECRVARVNVEGKEFIRSIGHLYPLEVQETLPLDTGVREIEVTPAGEESDSVGTDPINRTEKFTVQTEKEITVQNDVASESNEVDESRSPIPMEVVDDNGEDEDDFLVDDGREMGEGGDVNNGGNEERIKRTAAVRARKKIALWTSQLTALL